MKKITLFLLIMIVAFSITGCFQSEESKAVDEQIAALGEITLESEFEIVAAEQAVASLEEKDRKALKNIEILTTARSTYDTLVIEAQAKAVEDLISKIGEVSINDSTKEAIDEARKIFSGSTSEVQALVSNIDVLDTAEKTYAELLVKMVDDAINAIGEVTLESGDVIAKARQIYEESSSETKSNVKGLDVLTEAENTYKNLRVTNVIGLIDAIGEVTLESKDAIQKVREAYDDLGKEMIVQVTNADKLLEAESLLSEAKKKEMERMLGSFRVKEDEVRAMKFYDHKTKPYYADVRSYVMPYIGTDSNNRVWLCARLHYTDDDWVFFKKIIFSIDGKNTTKTYDYFKDVTRDNARGDVWEYINTGNGAEYREIFEAIVNSTKTIVRFQGDTYHSDLVVSQKDKDAIRETLALYDLMLENGYTE